MMTSANPVSLKFSDDVAYITIDNPPVNAASHAVREGLDNAVKAVTEKGVRAAVLKCAGRTFVAGGDIREFDKPTVEPHLPDVLDALEASPVSFIAAMHGTVLGGGFEIALACDFRVALADTRFGLPEVNIGLIPGAGGTQRLPRLVGVEAAAKIACSGIMFGAETMRDMGAIDAIVRNLDEDVEKILKNLPALPDPVSRRKTNSPGAAWFADRRVELKKAARGQQSPLHVLDAIEWSTKTEFAEGLKRERERFLELKSSAESRALRHAFFAERKVAKPEILKDAEPGDVENIAIVGGGLMGSGIAAACLMAGYNVRMIEADDKAARHGGGRVALILEGAVKRGKLDEAQAQKMMKAFVSGNTYDAAGDCDLAIEAVFEDLDAKRQVFGELAYVMKSDALLATNTSYLDPNAIFEGIDNPERCLGLHFFSPAHVMKLVEVVRASATTPQTLATGFAFARSLGKIPVLSGICEGFIGNRMLAAYRRQADYMLADGALPHEIDAAMRDFGMPMGPYELQDLTGLQIGWATRKRQAPTRDPNQRYVPVADRLCEMERFGQRSGKGWYRYEEGSREPARDEEVEALIEDYRKQQGIESASFDATTIQNRLIAALANEGALIVEEGIANSLDDVDVVKLHGYGFPRWRGGPMHFVAENGKGDYVKAMADVTAQSPKSWQLSDWLKG